MRMFECIRSKKTTTEKKSGKDLQLVQRLIKQTSLLFLLLTLSNPVLAHITIKGQVTDTNNEPLLGAVVAVKGTGNGTTTDANGNYSLILKDSQKEVTLSVSFMGYKTVERTINAKEKSINVSFRLKEDYTQLDEVTIVAKTEAQKLREKALPVSIISLSQIQGTVSNVNDILTKVSGVTIRNSGGMGSSSRISLRGLEGKRIGYFYDECPMGDRTELASLNDIPIDMIEAIEIYKGVVPAKFGGTAMGGAVNIVEKEYPPMYMDASYEIGSFNTHKANMVVKRNDEKRGFEYGFGGYYAYSDNDYEMELPLSPGTYVTRDHDAFRKYTIGGSVTAKKWWFDEVEFSPMFVNSHKEIQGIEYNIQEAYNDTWSFMFGNHLVKNNFLLPGLEFDMNQSFNYSEFHFVDKAENAYYWDGTPKIAVSGYGGEIGTDANDALTKKVSYSNKLNLNYVIDTCHSINLNIVANYLHGDPKDELKDLVMGYKSQYSSNMSNVVAGLCHEYKTKNQKLLSMFSLKYYMYSMQTKVVDDYGDKGNVTDIDMTQNNMGISEALRYSFTKSFMLKASAAYDVRIPSEEELLGDGFLIVPAPDLKPERNLSFNFGAMYDHYFGSKRLQIDVNAFAMYLDDMIRFSGSVLQSVYANFGKMRTLGVEVDVKSDITDYMYVFANATYQDLRDTRKYEAGSTVKNPTYNDRMPNIPYLLANGGIELHAANLFRTKGTNARLFFDCSFIEEYFYDFEQSIYQERRIPRSLLFNGGLEYKFCKESVIIGFQANNITNRKVLSEFNRPQPGRNFSLKLRYIWKKN